MSFDISAFFKLFQEFSVSIWLKAGQSSPKTPELCMVRGELDLEKLDENLAILALNERFDARTDLLKKNKSPLCPWISGISVVDRMRFTSKAEYFRLLSLPAISVEEVERFNWERAKSYFLKP